VSTEPPKLRFSLRSLVIVVVFLGTTTGLFMRWKPWITGSVEVHIDGEFRVSHFTMDGNLLVVAVFVGQSETDSMVDYFYFDTQSGTRLDVATRTSMKWDPYRWTVYGPGPLRARDGLAMRKGSNLVTIDRPAWRVIYRWHFWIVVFLAAASKWSLLADRRRLSANRVAH
jgi:hypothetical protein